MTETSHEPKEHQIGTVRERVIKAPKTRIEKVVGLLTVSKLPSRCDCVFFLISFGAFHFWDACIRCIPEASPVARLLSTLLAYLLSLRQRQSASGI